MLHLKFSLTPCSLNFIVFSFSSVYMWMDAIIFKSFGGREANKIALSSAREKKLLIAEFRINFSMLLPFQKSFVIFAWSEKNVFCHFWPNKSERGKNYLFPLSHNHTSKNIKTKNGIPFLCHQRSATWYFSFCLHAPPKKVFNLITYDSFTMWKR